MTQFDPCRKQLSSLQYLSSSLLVLQTIGVPRPVSQPKGLVRLSLISLGFGGRLNLDTETDFWPGHSDLLICYQRKLCIVHISSLPKRSGLRDLGVPLTPVKEKQISLRVKGLVVCSAESHCMYRKRLRP